jgi:glycine cleavage system H protein
MEFPKHLKYTREHEWALIEGNEATIGITEYAAEKLGDVVYVDLPEEGDNLDMGGTFGAVESVKAVSDLYSPLSGAVKEINRALSDSPEVINEDPYGEAWMIKLVIDDENELEELLTAEEYARFIAEERDEDEEEDVDDEEE